MFDRCDIDQIIVLLTRSVLEPEHYVESAGSLYENNCVAAGDKRFADLVFLRVEAQRSTSRYWVDHLCITTGTAIQ